VNSSSIQYFRNAAAVISYEPGGYIRLEWQPVASTTTELRAIYEHVLRAMQHHRAMALMTVHNQRPPMPPEVQTWLAEDWVPRATREVGYGRCAIVEAATPLSRLAARAVGANVSGPLNYQYFDTEAAAEAWLRG
jgi:hypothetical protein